MDIRFDLEYYNGQQDRLGVFAHYDQMESGFLEIAGKATINLLQVASVKPRTIVVDNYSRRYIRKDKKFLGVKLWDKWVCKFDGSATHDMWGVVLSSGDKYLVDFSTGKNILERMKNIPLGGDV